MKIAMALAAQIPELTSERLRYRAFAEDEITWALMPGHHGHGFATEAASTTLAAAYDHFGWTTAVSVVVQDNVASAKVAERLGATVERQIEFRGTIPDVWRHRPPKAS